MATDLGALIREHGDVAIVLTWWTVVSKPSALAAAAAATEVLQAATMAVAMAACLMVRDSQSPSQDEQGRQTTSGLELAILDSRGCFSRCWRIACTQTKED